MKQLLLCGLVIIAGVAWRQAAASDCENAVERYNSAINEVSYALRRYANCVSGSQGQDDCSSEFRRLKNAQYDFESAVSEMQSYCE